MIMRKHLEGEKISRNLGINIFVYFISISMAFGITLSILAFLGYDILRALITIITTSFRSSFGFQETIKKTIPLIFATYAFAVPFTIKFFNIGVWGQMLFGATMSTIVGLSLSPLNITSIVMIPLLLTTGIFAGGFYALIAGYLKSDYDINPIISTIMLNYVASYFLNFVATSRPFRDPVEGHPITIPLPETSTIGFFMGIPYSIFFILVTVLFVYVLLKKTRLGFEITAVGQNMEAARIYGINFRKTIMITFFIGGTIAGLGGVLEILNIHGKLIEGFARTSGAQYGIFGILTCLIVAGNPMGIPVAAFLMSVLLVGADALQRTMQIPVELVFSSQALIVLFILIIRSAVLRKEI